MIASASASTLDFPEAISFTSTSVPLFFGEKALFAAAAVRMTCALFAGITDGTKRNELTKREGRLLLP